MHMPCYARSLYCDNHVRNNGPADSGILLMLAAYFLFIYFLELLVTFAWMLANNKKNGVFFLFINTSLYRYFKEGELWEKLEIGEL